MPARARGSPVYDGHVHARAVVVGLAVLWAASAAGASLVRRAIDRVDGVSFALHGRMLTARLAPQENSDPPDSRGRLYGRSVRAVCHHGRGTSRRTLGIEVRKWGRGVHSVRFTLSRDVSRGVKWCLLEDPRGGGDIAFARFR